MMETEKDDGRNALPAAAAAAAKARKRKTTRRTFARMCSFEIE